jgi:hypothetical protein
MMLIGVDYHPSFQQIAFFAEETGECGERQLNHSEGEAEGFYRDLLQRGIHVRVGMEATGYARWFERLVAGLGFRDMDRRSRGDSEQARQETEDRPQGCPASAAVVAGR